MVATTHRSKIKVNITAFVKQQPWFIVPGLEDYLFKELPDWMNAKHPERNLEELSVYLLSSFVVNSYIWGGLK